jgi:PAS domain-containing protein
MNDGDSKKSVNLEKSPLHHPHRPVAYFLSNHRSNIRLVMSVGLSAFLCEILLMFVIHPLSHLPLWLMVLVDALGLVLILSPLLYVFILRPMVQTLNERERAEKALLESEMRFRTIFSTSPDAVIVSRLYDGSPNCSAKAWRSTSKPSLTARTAVSARPSYPPT